MKNISKMIYSEYTLNKFKEYVLKNIGSMSRMGV